MMSDKKSILSFKTLWHKRKAISITCLIIALLIYGGVYAGMSLWQSNTNKVLELEDGRALAYRVETVHGSVSHPQAKMDQPLEEQRDVSDVKQKQYVVLVHGTPGDATSWTQVLNTAKEMELTGDYEFYVVDRLGFGNSDEADETDLYEHADAVLQLIKTLPEKPIVVGHSYGGAVSLKLASMASDHIAGVVLIAPAVQPWVQDTVWFRALANHTGHLLPEMLRTSRAEVMDLTSENQVLHTELSKIKVPVTLIHGVYDSVCPYEETRDTLHQRLTGTEVKEIKLDYGGHYLQRFYPKVIMEEIQSLHLSMD